MFILDIDIDMVAKRGFIEDTKRDLENNAGQRKAKNNNQEKKHC